MKVAYGEHLNLEDCVQSAESFAGQAGIENQESEHMEDVTSQKRKLPEDFEEPPTRRPKGCGSEVCMLCSAGRSNCTDESPLPCGLDPTLLKDGWHGPLPSGEWVHLSSMTSRLKYGKFKLKTYQYPSVSVYGLSEPSGVWELLAERIPRGTMDRLPNVYFHVAEVFYPAEKGHQVFQVQIAVGPELGFESSDEDDEHRPKSLVDRKVEQQVQSEIPSDLIPKEHHHLYEAAMKKEWQEWLKCGSVKVHDLNTSRQLCRDPSVIPYIMGSRFCFRNKNAGTKALDVLKLKKTLVHAKARLVLQAYRAPNKSRIRKDSPTASRNGFYVLVKIGISLDFIFVSGGATSAFMQGGGG